MESESEDSHYFRLYFQLRRLRSTYELVKTRLSELELSLL